MASKLEFVQYVAGQMEGAGAITWRRMFGEYGLYRNGIYFACVCDDQLFVKITDAGRRIAPHLREVPPYQGAKPCLLVEDVDDRELLVRLAEETCRELPPPKPKNAGGRNRHGL